MAARYVCAAACGTVRMAGRDCQWGCASRQEPPTLRVRTQYTSRGAASKPSRVYPQLWWYTVGEHTTVCARSKSKGWRSLTNGGLWPACSAHHRFGGPYAGPSFDVERRTSPGRREPTLVRGLFPAAANSRLSAACACSRVMGNTAPCGGERGAPPGMRGGADVYALLKFRRAFSSSVGNIWIATNMTTKRGTCVVL